MSNYLRFFDFYLQGSIAHVVIVFALYSTLLLIWAFAIFLTVQFHLLNRPAFQQNLQMRFFLLAVVLFTVVAFSLASVIFAPMVFTL
jgi:hypothetical protein